MILLELTKLFGDNIRYLLYKQLSILVHLGFPMMEEGKRVSNVSLIKSPIPFMKTSPSAIRNLEWGCREHHSRFISDIKYTRC